MIESKIRIKAHGKQADEEFLDQHAIKVRENGVYGVFRRAPVSVLKRKVPAPFLKHAGKIGEIAFCSSSFNAQEAHGVGCSFRPGCQSCQESKRICYDAGIVSAQKCPAVFNLACHYLPGNSQGSLWICGALELLHPQLNVFVSHSQANPCHLKKSLIVWNRNPGVMNS